MQFFCLFFYRHPLYCAISQNNQEIVQLLLTNELHSSKFNMNDNHTKHLIITAIENENIEIIKLLLNRDDVNIDETREIEVPEYYLTYSTNEKKDPKKSTKQMTALEYAILIGNKEIVKLLFMKKGIQNDSEYNIFNFFFLMTFVKILIFIFEEQFG